jgi:hypothetical protein
MSRKVFISHKAKDKTAAEKIRREISLLGSGNLELFVSERIRPGTMWAPQIWDNLKKADWLFLLYTDPSEEWDWCLFEAGFFAGFATEKEGRLVCLHTTDVPPPMPLQGWQSVSITEEDKMENFLKDLYTGINQELINSPDKLRGLADRIAEAFSLEVRRKLDSIWDTEYVTLSMDKAQLEELDQTGRVPGGAVCGLKNDESLDIFGHGTEECTMETLEGGLNTNYKEMWLMSLGDTLRAANQKKRPIPRIPSLYASALKKDFHVVLHCVDSYSDGSKEFYLLFVEKMPENQDAQGRQLRFIGDMLKLGRKFRWQILTKFHRELCVLKRRQHVEKDIEECMERLGWSMDWVIGECQRLGILMPEDVAAAFTDEDVRKTLLNSLVDVWPGLFNAARESIADSDIDKAVEALAGMLKANKEYMIHAAGRYQELLKEMP